MPRQARKRSYSNVYHCMLRGINRQDIFFENEDYLKFQEIIKKSKEKFYYQLYSYVLMPNHIHLEIKDENQKLSNIIQSISISYSNYFNKKYQRKGHLFENRFQSRNVENSYYILNLVRYIHQNPAKAGISKMKEYKWSSYSEYFENENSIVDTQEILAMIAPTIEQAQKFFLEFNNKTVKFEESVELLEYEMRNKLKDEEAIEFIKEKLGISNLQEIQKYNKNYRNDIIRKLKELKGITKIQISRILGINMTIVRKAFYEDNN